MQFLRKLRPPALFCAALFLLCELISRPWAEMGICDEWSYIRTTQLLATAGHLVYNGAASAIVGWQFYVGAALIRLFGFSFTAPRMGTLLIALLTVCLLQRTLVRLGITERNATLGTLAFVLSPLFMMLSVTMMTDVPGFFSVLACLYACLRALQSARDRTAIFWLAAAISVNAICGTSRQVAWLGILVLLPSTLFLLRAKRTVLAAGLAMTALGYAFVFAAFRWYSTQPYSLQEPSSRIAIRLWIIKLISLQFVRAFFEIGLLLLPLTMPFLAQLPRLVRRNLAGLAALAASALAFVFYLGHKPALVALFQNPFNGDWVGARAMYGSTFLASQPPIVLGRFLLVGIALLTFLAMLSIAGTLVLARPKPVTETAAVFSWHTYLVLFAPIALVYFLLLSRHAQILLFDRYLLLPLFLALACLLRYSQERLNDRLNNRLPLATILAIAIFATYGVASTHNLFALNRARVSLAAEAIAQGVPPSHLDMGWEWNGWYELQVSPSVNDGAVQPVGIYRVFHEPSRSGCHEGTPFGFYPHLAPRYGVAFTPAACNGVAPFAPVSYSTWPLGTPTTIYLVNYPPPWRSALETAASSSSTTMPKSTTSKP